jgi:hypothetical protein
MQGRSVIPPGTGTGGGTVWRQAAAGTLLGCAALLASGCGSASQPAPAAPAQPSQATPAATAISPAQRKTAARSYLAIARPANRRLDRDFDGLEDSDHDDLAAAQADLLDAAATERLFDRRLLRLELPPATEPFAHLLVTANQARARLSVAAAASTSLSQLRGYEGRLTAANEPVEEAARVIRSQLSLPPPETS